MVSTGLYTILAFLKITQLIHIFTLLTQRFHTNSLIIASLSFNVWAQAVSLLRQT